MKTCDKCNITIATNHDHCPLCHQVLTGSMEKGFEELYPIKGEHQNQLPPRAMRIISFISIVLIVTLGTINFLDQSIGFWSIIPIGSIIYLWVLMRYSVFSRVYIIRRIAGTTVILILLLVFLNLSTDLEQLWSLNYALPSLVMANNLVFLLIMLIKRQGVREYARCFLLMFVLSLTPLIIYLIGLSDVLTLAVITFAQGLLILLFMIVFYPRILKELLQKMFHI